MTKAELSVRLEQSKQAALAKLERVGSADELEQLRATVLGRRSSLAEISRAIPGLPASERGEIGRQLNQARAQIEAAFGAKKSAHASGSAATDFRVPGAIPWRGHLHPLTRFARKVTEIWRSLGYDLHEGPELETTWYNFDGLNVPPDHPARDIQDTFFIRGHRDLVLRTHSSTVQLRAIIHHARRQPPARFIEIGKVYRNEATDATHESTFMQCDGVLVDRHVSLAHLIATLRTFVDRLYPGAKVRIRPSYFPFVEPGIELDMWWERNGKKGVWLEMLGAGLVHPNVIRAMGLSPKSWQGFAFGMGLDRLAMLELGVTDIRLFYNGDLSFLEQF